MLAQISGATIRLPTCGLELIWHSLDRQLKLQFQLLRPLQLSLPIESGHIGTEHSFALSLRQLTVLLQS